MTIPRSSAGDVEVRVSILRDGKEIVSKDGNKDVRDFVQAIEIYESITSATLEAKFVINDGSGFLGAMTGSELFKIQIIGTIIDKLGVEVRTGQHCTQPIMDFYKISGTIRASFAFYNTKEEIDIFIAAINKAKMMLS